MDGSNPKSVLEFSHHTFGIGIGDPCKDLIFSLRFFDMLKISSQEVLLGRHILDSETLYSDGVKHTTRVIFYNNQVIEASGHIRIVVSFISHPDVAPSHVRDKTKYI